MPFSGSPDATQPGGEYQDTKELTTKSSMQHAGTYDIFPEGEFMGKHSTTAQDESGQVKQLKAAGCGKIFREKITGTTTDRPQLGKLTKRLAPGDVVITPAVDRLSRDTTDLLVIAREMQRTGAGIRSLAEPFLDTTSDFAEIILAILGVAAKLERRRILQRTARGRSDAKAKGVKFGRKPTLTSHQQKEARKRLDAGETQRSVARSYNVSQATISRLPPNPFTTR